MHPHTLTLTHTLNLFSMFCKQWMLKYRRFLFSKRFFGYNLRFDFWWRHQMGFLAASFSPIHDSENILSDAHFNSWTRRSKFFIGPAREWMLQILVWGKTRLNWGWVLLSYPWSSLIGCELRSSNEGPQHSRLIFSHSRLTRWWLSV